MIYSSIVFLFYFLFVVLIYAFVTKSLKVPWLIIASFIWISSWSLSWGIIFFGITAFNYLALHLLKNLLKKARDYGFILLLFFNVVFFVSLKAGNAFGLKFDSPYGVSFFMFITFAYVVDLWRSGKAFEMEKITHFLLMPVFFPLLVGGPIVRSKEFLPQLKSRLNFSFENFIDGLTIFGYGFCKIYFLSKSLEILSMNFMNYGAHESFFIVLLSGFIATFHAYVDFSSYCDMGRGVAKCLGINLNVNFRAFYYAKNPNDFWQRWNITLGTWIRDYISFPMMLRWGRKINQNIILIFSFLLVGLWHGLAINWVMFGLYNGVIVVSYNWFNKKIRVPAVGYIFAALIFIGNGLLQETSWFRPLKHNIKHFRFWSLNLPWRFLFDRIPTELFITLSILLIFEYVQEFTKDVDWYTKKDLRIKVVVAILFIVWIFYSLNNQMFIKEVILPPAYFRI